MADKIKIDKEKLETLKKIYKTKKPVLVKQFKANSDYLFCLSFSRLYS